MEIMQDMGSAFFPCVCHKTQVVVLATNFGSHNPSTFCIFLCLLGGEGGFATYLWSSGSQALVCNRIAWKFC